MTIRCTALRCIRIRCAATQYMAACQTRRSAQAQFASQLSSLAGRLDTSKTKAPWLDRVGQKQPSLGLANSRNRLLGLPKTV